MRLNRLFSVAMLSIIFGGTASAQQPYGGCWHPEHVKNWSPETDKNAKFNRSKVPLAKRFKEPTLMKANKNQFYEGQVCNATILFTTCSS
jgi:endo-beta-N-acetylglucosaminidase D